MNFENILIANAVCSLVHYLKVPPSLYFCRGVVVTGWRRLEPWHVLTQQFITRLHAWASLQRTFASVGAVPAGVRSAGSDLSL